MLIISSRFDYGVCNNFIKQSKKKKLKIISFKQLLLRFKYACAHIMSGDKTKNKKKEESRTFEKSKHDKFINRSCSRSTHLTGNAQFKKINS